MTEATSEALPAGLARERTVHDRALAAAPAVGAAIALLTLYFVQAWMRETPWIFTDELEWTQLSRAIEETGHAARRGEPIDAKSLYAYLIAPFWAIGSTPAAYAAIKYANVVVMCLAAAPTYLLARMLVPRGAAVVVALLAICIPAMAYATSIVPEALAYPWFALASWLVVRALTTRRRLDVAVAVIASVAAVYVRSKLIVVPGAFALAAGWLWFSGPRGRSLRAGWSRWDKAGAAVLAVGLFLVVNRAVLHRSQEWSATTEHAKRLMLDLGLDAGLALTVGLGVLPVIGGVMSLHLPGRRDPAYRAFAAYLGTALGCLFLYTAVKAAYLATTFSTLTLERNLFYLSPLLLIGTAMVLLADRVDWRLGAAAAAVISYQSLTRLDVLQTPYFEAPGSTILDTLGYRLGLGRGELQAVVIVAVVLSLVVLLLRSRRAVLVSTAAFLVVWMQVGQIEMSRGMNRLASGLRAQLPEQLDWIDRATGGEPVTFLGQQIDDANALLMTEFWNRSLERVQSFDNTAPGPGPTMTPDLVGADGTLARTYDTRYVLAGTGVVLDGETIASNGQFTLYRTGLPWRLLDGSERVYPDGWISNFGAYTYHRPGESGVLEVALARTGYLGNAPAGRARVRAGEVVMNEEHRPALGRVFFDREVLVRNGSAQTLRIPVAQTPVRVEVSIDPTFQPETGDSRELGAQVAFGFVPRDSG